MKDRIRQLMEDQHLTQQTFAQMIGSSTATLSNIFNGKTNPSLSIVDGIHKSFPQVNVYWVLYGTPPMYQSQGGQSAQDGTSSVAAPLSAGEQDGVMDRVLAESEGGGNVPGYPSLETGAGTGLGASASSVSPSLFGQSQMHGANSTAAKNIAQAAVKYVDKPQRKITEIRIFYDDQTWETFVPKK